MNDDYKRNPKGIRGGKYGPNEQDQDDFAQEKLIEQWLSQTGAGEVKFQYINRKGTARNTIDQRSVRLDQQVSDEPGSGTYADITPGSDGRDLECRLDPPEPEIDIGEEIRWHLFALGFTQGELECLEKILKSSTQENRSPFERSTSSSESWTQFEHFKSL